MSVVPKKKSQRITWFGSKIGPWREHSETLKLDVDAVDALDTKTQAALAAMNAHVAARSAARSAALAFNEAVGDMTKAGTALISQIRTTAKTEGNNIFVLADLPAPNPPSPKPAPGTPHNLAVTLDGNGALHLKWACSNPPGSTGTLYQIFRKIGDAPVTYLGGSGEKKWTDTTVPAGATALMYQVQAVRSKSVGMWATFNVFFGTNAGGATTLSVEQTTAPKLAA